MNPRQAAFAIDPHEFSGKRALVTGGTKGAGEAIVRRLVAGGATVATTARSESPNDAAAKLFIQAEIRDWTRSHANFFRAVQIEKRVMFIILTLIVAVAAFNIVSAQVMVVTDKQADIAILRTLGASPSSIMAIFVVQGALIGFIGTAIGVAGGVLLALNIDVVVPFIERTFSVQFLDKSVYYITDLPSDVQRGDVITIAAIALGLALVATLYPAWKAARVSPAEALRYE